jgi:hypothetical protein
MLWKKNDSSKFGKCSVGQDQKAKKPFAELGLKMVKVELKSDLAR